MPNIAGVIKDIRQENYKIKSYFIELERKLCSVPGQYVMVWYPGAEEIPISVAHEDGRIIRLIIAKVGDSTSYIHNHAKRGDYISIRGPYGKGFTVVKGMKVACVAGGYGIAPLFYLAKKLLEKNAEVHIFFGVKSKEDLFLLEELSATSNKLFVTTEDGTYGFKGLVTDIFKQYFFRERYDYVYTCGPERMMFKIVSLCISYGVKVEACLERYIRCGVGLCGSCVLDPIGLRVCCEGPVIKGDVLLNTDFGKFKRDEFCRKVSI